MLTSGKLGCLRGWVCRQMKMSTVLKCTCLTLLKPWRGNPHRSNIYWSEESIYAFKGTCLTNWSSFWLLLTKVNKTRALFPYSYWLPVLYTKDCTVNQNHTGAGTHGRGDVHNSCSRLLGWLETEETDFLGCEKRGSCNLTLTELVSSIICI